MCVCVDVVLCVCVGLTVDSEKFVTFSRDFSN